MGRFVNHSPYGLRTSRLKPTRIMHCGVWAKIEEYQMNYAISNRSLISAIDDDKHPHMPYPYDKNDSKHVDSIFWELDTYPWLKGILVEFNPGKVEASAGVRDWTFYDVLFDTVEGLTKTTGQNKKIMLLLPTRRLALNEPERIVPLDLLGAQTPGTNSGYYRNPVMYDTDPDPAVGLPVNALKIGRLWCYLQGSNPKGYNLNLYQFRDGLTGNDLMGEPIYTLRDRMYSIYEAMAARYSDRVAFGGVILPESAIGSPFPTYDAVDVQTGTYESGNSVTNHYLGRKAFLKKMKTLFPRHLVVESPSFDLAWHNSMCQAGATDGLIANKMAFSTPDMHIGTNLYLQNIRDNLCGNVPILMQVQPLNYGSITGNRTTYYGWTPTPDDGYGAPTTSFPAPDSIDDNDPPTMAWLLARARYFNSHYLIMQRNLNSSGNGWQSWVAYMQANFANNKTGIILAPRPSGY